MSDRVQARGVAGRAFDGVARTAGAALAMVLLASLGLAAKEKEPTRVKMRILPIASTRGVDLYQAYCVQCHGKGGKGDGGLATGLRKPPADLTRIAERHGGTFSRVSVGRYIMGDRAGGSQSWDQDWNPVVARDGGIDDMPLWSFLFEKLYPDQPNRLRFESLAQYTESLQGK